MSSDVKNIFRTVEKHSARRSFRSYLGDTKLERSLVVVAALSLVFAVVGVFVNELQVLALVAGLTFLLSIILLVLAQGYSIVATFHTPLRGYAEEAERRMDERAAFVSELASFSSDGLSIAKGTMANDALRVQKRLSLLIGAVEKAGFIPAGLALYYAAVKAQSGSDELPANLLMAFVFGLYGGAFLGHRIVEALNYNISCVNDAYEIVLRREQFYTSAISERCG